MNSSLCSSVSLSGWLILFTRPVSAQHPEPLAVPSGKNREDNTYFVFLEAEVHPCMASKENKTGLILQSEEYESIKRHTCLI